MRNHMFEFLNVEFRKNRIGLSLLESINIVCQNCIFANNMIGITDSNDSMSSRHTSELIFDKSLLYGNETGISIHHDLRTLSLQHCTITQNTVSQIVVVKPTVRDGELRKMVVKDSIIWGGDFEDGIAIIGPGGGLGQAIFDVTYSDISVFEGVWEGEGNINADPRFVDPTPATVEGDIDPDFALQEGSPCIDAGDPESPLDRDGSRTDMGAIEFVHTM